MRGFQNGCQNLYAYRQSCIFRYFYANFYFELLFLSIAILHIIQKNR